MNFFEVKIGKTSRRGNFEPFNSFVAKTEMNSHELYNSLRERYKGFEVSVNNVETIVEFEKPVVVEENVFAPIVEKSTTVQHLSLRGTCRHIDKESEISILRKDFEEKKRDYEKSETKLREVIKNHLEDKHEGIAKEIIKLKSTYAEYLDYEYILKLNGDLKQMLEEDDK